MRITIVGCGVIGSALAKAADEMIEVKRIYLIDTDKKKAEALNAKINKGVVVNSVEEELYHCDLVVEAASQEAAKDILTKTVGRGVDIMLMSVGALVDDDYRESIFKKAKDTDANIYIPSGALLGADGLRSASMYDGLESVEMISTAGIETLRYSQCIEDGHIDVDSLKEKTQLFKGSARTAVAEFPKFINIAATLSLLGLGFDKTTVTVILDPSSKEISHEIRVKGKYTSFTTVTHNVPAKDNPMSSEVSSNSAIAALRRIIRSEWIGL